MHYYKKNIGDYSKKAGRLSMLQHGAYNLLIDSCYDRERFPTLEEAIEWTWASSSEEIEAVEFVLNRFFSLDFGVYVQQHIQEDLDKYHANSATNRRIALDREAKRRQKSTKRERPVNEAPPNQEPRTTNHEPVTNKKTPSTEVDNRPLEIFTYWKDVMGKNNSAKPTAKRMSCIKARLKEGYPIERIKLAIDGCRGSAYHRGDNDQGKIYDDLTLICRSGDKVEAFEGYLNRVPVKETGQMSAMDQLTDTTWADDLMGYEPGNGIIDHD